MQLALTDCYSEMTPSLLPVFILKCATKTCTCKLHAVGLRAEGGSPLPIQLDSHNNNICWPLPSNQSFYRQIAIYGMGVGDHRVG